MGDLYASAAEVTRASIHAAFSGRHVDEPVGLSELEGRLVDALAPVLCEAIHREMGRPSLSGALSIRITETAAELAETLLTDPEAADAGTIDERVELAARAMRKDFKPAVPRMTR